MIHKLNINNIERYDVVVCGGGMTGFAAAVTSARVGKKTLLIEKGTCLGGVGTAGGVNILLGGIKYGEEKYNFITGGLFKELYYNLRKTDDCVDIYKINRERSPHAWYPGLAESIIFDNEAMKDQLESIAVESGVKIKYMSYIFDVKTNENNIDYILITGKSGNTAVKADVFIDSTGDADIAKMSGCSYVLGRDEDNLMTPATLIMFLEDVDTEKVLEYIEKNKSPRFREKIKSLRQKGEWPFDFDIFISALINKEGYHMVNSIRQVGIDGTDTDSLTEGIIEGRKENKQLFNILKKYFPGYEKAKISSMTETIGIRETRRIIGEFVLTFSALMSGEEFDDIIALSSYCFDLPDPKRPSHQPLEGQKIKKRYTEIPYRCMLPDKIDNLLVAGRSISVEREVLGPIRVMGPCIGMGQAAGAAAAMAADKDSSVKDVDVLQLKEKLKSINCITDESQVCEVRNNI